MFENIFTNLFAIFSVVYCILAMWEQRKESKLLAKKEADKEDFYQEQIYLMGRQIYSLKAEVSVLANAVRKGKTAEINIQYGFGWEKPSKGDEE